MKWTLFQPKSIELKCIILRSFKSYLKVFIAANRTLYMSRAIVYARWMLYFGSQTLQITTVVLNTHTHTASYLYDCENSSSSVCFAQILFILHSICQINEFLLICAIVRCINDFTWSQVYILFPFFGHFSAHMNCEDESIGIK